MNHPVYHEATLSLCPVCRERIPGKIYLHEGQVFLDKKCPAHGLFHVLLEEDAGFWLNRRSFDKPGTDSLRQSETRRGCPFDCGLCPEHDQHSCIGLFEITETCDLGCPVCFARSGAGKHVPLETLKRMTAFLLEAEGGQLEILQISGGEPTLHPELVPFLNYLRQQPIRHIILNTHGLTLPGNPELLAALASFTTGFELYLQFDGVTDAPYEALRGRPLLREKTEVLEHLSRLGIPMTLAVTAAAGINDEQLGQLFRLGLNTPSVRGICFQPLAQFGRLPVHQPPQGLTPTGIMRRLCRQTGSLLSPEDFVPLPCNVERVIVSYLLKKNGAFMPITKQSQIKSMLPLIDNTLNVHLEDLEKAARERLKSGGDWCNCFQLLRDIQKRFPKTFTAGNTAARKAFLDSETFRITIVSFVDAWNFDLKSAQKECVHLVTPDLKRIPFSMYNTLYREGAHD